MDGKKREGVLGLARRAVSGVAKAAETVGEGTLTGVVKAAEAVGGAVGEAGRRLGGHAVKRLDRNGDGVLDEQDVLLILGEMYTRAVNGIPGVSKSVEIFSAEYMTRSADPHAAARKMVESAIAKCATSGFLSGLGGAITLPVSLPANVTSTLYVQLRMIAAVASMAGLDIRSDAGRTLVYACLADVSVTEMVKKAGVQLGRKLTNAAIQSIPAKALTAINQKVGFTFVTRFGEHGVINLGKMVPVVGAVISGGFDLAETRAIAGRALKAFLGE